MWIKQSLIWFSGFFSDQKGNASRKAAGFYVSALFLYIQNKAAVDGKIINEMVLGADLIIFLFCLGAITAEWFKGFKNSEDFSKIKKEE